MIIREVLFSLTFCETAKRTIGVRALSAHWDHVESRIAWYEFSCRVAGRAGRAFVLPIRRTAIGEARQQVRSGASGGNWPANDLRVINSKRAALYARSHGAPLEQYSGPTGPTVPETVGHQFDSDRWL